jgi:PIN domain nuclease of toxin-antitoxin system
MTYVLDACALLAFLNDESGAEGIETILNQSVAGECAVAMHINNLLEVFYGQLRERGLEIATIVLAAVDAYSITIIDTISDPVFHKAAHIKAAYKCSLADAIGLATAFDLSGTFVTSDGEIKPVEAGEPISILWFRQPETQKGKKKTDLQTIIAERDRAAHALAEANRRIAELETKK